MFYDQFMGIKVPFTVSPDYKSEYIKNYDLVTHSSGRLMLFAGDQKVEHLNHDFYGENISEEDNNPEHLFRIASKAKIGVFGTQLGLIAKYGMDYPQVPYLVKLNSKTNLVKTAQKDPLSESWYEVSRVIEFKKQSELNIVGVGYTVYLGSEFESQMLSEAAKIIANAQYYGLLTILWMYPRGAAVKDEKDPDIIAGAAGVGATLGADFVKVNAPKKENKADASLLKQAVAAAGRTKVICAGGESEDPKIFLKTLHDQIHIGGTAGSATGRNIHQKSLNEAIKFCNAIYAVTVENKSFMEAEKYLNGK